MSSLAVDVRGRPWSPAVIVAPYVVLAALALCTVIIKQGETSSLLVDLALCAAAAAWIAWMVTLHPGWRDRPRTMVIFFTGLIAILAVLVVRDPWFGIFAPVAYIYAFRVLRWPWLLAGAAAVAMLAGTAQASSVDKSTVFGLIGYFAVLAVNVVPMCGYAWIEWHQAKQHDQRDNALAEVSQANRELEAMLAENAALHERLLVQAREAGVLDERQRMAREIHDTLAQGLTGIITQLQAVEQAREDPARWRRHVEAATGLARESLSEARRSVHALRPEPLRTARLADALADVGDRWSSLHKVPIEVTTTGTPRPMHPEAEVALLRTAQEALANIAKHARATRVGVTLSYLEHEIALDVRDDGTGFTPQDLVLRTRAGVDGQREGAEESREGGGFGLVAMRERIEGLSGALQVESEPGNGTAISARIPATFAGATA
ncbi:sensor histidine kinase [Kribbella sp. VKM Ac-2568]|uniref:sensor histidine kinase n=1 Tax=Kribbella sp. VKM Ac-2568 TaxID=2512219 RepID=UPI0018EE6D96|nr:sensor histidine kinase [Kribbella sp. VKM Ac-2568]